MNTISPNAIRLAIAVVRSGETDRESYHIAVAILCDLAESSLSRPVPMPVAVSPLPRFAA